MVIFFAALGLPGLCGFIGEVLVVLSVWSFSMTLAVISAAVVILTAGYILWTIQRVYLGPEYKGPHPEALRPMTLREIAIAAPLVVMAVVLGVFPETLLKYTDATIKGFVKNLNPARQSAQFNGSGNSIAPSTPNPEGSQQLAGGKRSATTGYRYVKTQIDPGGVTGDTCCDPSGVVETRASDNPGCAPRPGANGYHSSGMQTADITAPAMTPVAKASP